MGVVTAVACMPVWHGVWKTSEPLSDLDQWLNIAKHDPNVNTRTEYYTKVVVIVSATPSSGLYTLCPMASTRGARGVTLVVARRGPEGRARKRVLHHDALGFKGFLLW